MHPNIKEQIEPNFSIHSKFKLLKGRFLKQKHKLNCLVRLAMSRYRRIYFSKEILKEDVNRKKLESKIKATIQTLKNIVKKQSTNFSLYKTNT